jgi:F-type H+-transporting ATPase subunit gamma
LKKVFYNFVKCPIGKSFAFESIDKIFKSDLIMQRKTQSLVHGTKTLIVPITSDKGLCGAINTGLIRQIKERIRKSQNKNDFGIMTIGEKGTAALLRPYPEMVRCSISDITLPVNYPTISSIAQQVSLVGSNYDNISLYYNEFKSAIRTIVRELNLFPRHKFDEYMKFMKLYKQSRPDKYTSTPALYDLYLASNIYQAFLNNAASEQSARMAAMENASKNAKEIVIKLNLEYNKARQARITMELVEIISGASAV